jgi:hypothetical protein
MIGMKSEKQRRDDCRNNKASLGYKRFEVWLHKSVPRDEFKKLVDWINRKYRGE